MSFSGKKSLRTERKIRNGNSIGSIIDIVNFVLGILVIICTFVIFLNYKKYNNLFAIAFLLSASMNICMGIKYFKRHEIIKFISLILAGIFLIIMTVISFMAFW